VLAAYIMHEEAIAEGKSITDANRLACVRYEELAADPIGQMERLYKELDLGNFDQVRGRIEKYVADATGYVRNRFTISSVQKASVETAWGALIKAKGYCWPEQYMSLAS
jgi:omega-hydroxy-beta-dihydromenaquinone-9 sulfotransferase